MKRKFFEAMGFSEKDRLIIVNSDDFGLCHSSNLGTTLALEEGFATSASLLIAAPWSFEAIDWWKTHPQYSIGVEIALTSEWQNYRFGPMAPREKVPSLIDPDGCFWGNVDLFKQHAQVEHAELEARTQIESVLRRGLSPTHYLNHMFSLASRPDMRQLYLRLLRDYKLPGRLPQDDPACDWPCIDSLVGFDLYYLSMESGKERRFYQILQDLEPGLYEFYPHCAVDSPEIRAICGYSRFIPQDPNSWVGRVSDTELYTLSCALLRGGKADGLPQLPGYQPRRAVGSTRSRAQARCARRCSDRLLGRLTLR